MEEIWINSLTKFIKQNFKIILYLNEVENFYGEAHIRNSKSELTF